MIGESSMTSATVLVVDDQPDILENIAAVLEAAGHRALMARDGLEALALLQKESVDLILADIAMPRMNGYELYERARADPRWVAIPFVFLTARTLDSDIRYGKKLGVDDYVTKPFHLEDLMAVVNGKLRRARQLRQALAPSASKPGEQVYRVGRLQMDVAQHQVQWDGRPVRLSAREWALLERLARQPGKVIPPQELIRVTHSLDTNVVEAGALVRPLIRSLRRKLGYAAGEMGCIEAVRGVGYRLIAHEIQEAHDQDSGRRR